jgi:hypothetical protein
VDKRKSWPFDRDVEEEKRIIDATCKSAWSKGCVSASGMVGFSQSYPDKPRKTGKKRTARRAGRVSGHGTTE